MHYYWLQFLDAVTGSFYIALSLFCVNISINQVRGIIVKDVKLSYIRQNTKLINFSCQNLLTYLRNRIEKKAIGIKINELNTIATISRLFNCCCFCCSSSLLPVNAIPPSPAASLSNSDSIFC